MESKIHFFFFFLNYKRPEPTANLKTENWNEMVSDPRTMWPLGKWDNTGELGMVEY